MIDIKTLNPEKIRIIYGQHPSKDENVQFWNWGNGEIAVSTACTGHQSPVSRIPASDVPELIAWLQSAVLHDEDHQDDAKDVSKLADDTEYERFAMEYATELAKRSVLDVTGTQLVAMSATLLATGSEEGLRSLKALMPPEIANDPMSLATMHAIGTALAVIKAYFDAREAKDGQVQA